MQKNHKFIDFHSHFLPCIDDGSDSLEMSKNMLVSAFNQGVEKIIATPHFYPMGNINVKDSVKLRSKSLCCLENYLNENNIEYPEILSGFEVAYSKALLDMDDLDELCIGNTKYILLELPYGEWENDIDENIFNLTIKGYKPILAHIDRYFSIKEEAIYNIVDLNVDFQINDDAFLQRKTIKFVEELLKRDRVCFIGSDMHNLDVRSCNLSRTYEIAFKKFKNLALDLYYNNANNLIFNK